MQHLPATAGDSLNPFCTAWDHATPVVTALRVIKKESSGRKGWGWQRTLHGSALRAAAVSHLTVPRLDDGHITYAFF